MKAIWQLIVEVLQPATLLGSQVFTSQLRLGVRQLLLIFLTPAVTEEVLDPADVQVQQTGDTQRDGGGVRREITLHPQGKQKDEGCADNHCEVGAASGRIAFAHVKTPVLERL